MAVRPRPTAAPRAARPRLPSVYSTSSDEDAPSAAPPLSVASPLYQPVPGEVAGPVDALPPVALSLPPVHTPQRQRSLSIPREEAPEAAGQPVEAAAAATPGPDGEAPPERKRLRDFLCQLSSEKKVRRTPAPGRKRGAAASASPPPAATAQPAAAPATPAQALQFKRGADGKLQLDASTLVQSGVRDLDEEALVEVEDYQPRSAYAKRNPGLKWSLAETVLFYDALRTCGLDFALMEPIFPKREPRHVGPPPYTHTPAVCLSVSVKVWPVVVWICCVTCVWGGPLSGQLQLKLKFKREEKLHPDLVEAALRSAVSFDNSEYQKLVAKAKAATAGDEVAVAPADADPTEVVAGVAEGEE